MIKLKLYVWEGVLTDYTSGMVCILAHSEGEAWELLRKKDDGAWWELQGDPNVLTQEEKDLPVGDERYAAYESQSERALQWLKDNKRFKYDTAANPVCIDVPEAFVVWGGG